MSSRTEIEAQVIDAIQRHLRATDRHLDARTRFIDDLGADSLALAELTLVFEETFDVDISDEEADRIRTVRDAIVAVEKALRAQRRG
jgi:acyl carrier protein